MIGFDLDTYRLLLERIPAIIYIVALDEASSLLYVSPQIEHYLGFTPRDWLADPQRWLMQLHPDDWKGVLAARSHTRATGEPCSCEYRMLTCDGRTLWFRDETALLHGQDGAALYLYGVMFDITQRKEVEAALARIHQQFAESQHARLTKGELQVLRLVRPGITTRQIADVLRIGERTVRYRMRSACDKLGARDRNEAIGMVERLGLFKE